MLRTAATLWLLAITYVDARTATISNWLTVPAMALLGGWRMLRAGGYALRSVAVRVGAPSGGRLGYAVSDQQALSVLLLMVLAGAISFVLWALHILGGGDAKTLMGIFALFPTVEFALFLTIGVLVLSLPLLVLRLRHRRLLEVLQALGKRLKEGPFFPTQRELQEQGRPYAWTFCLPGVVYLWLLW